MRYEVSLPVFSGPMELLLKVILSQDLEIYDVPIARITDDYLAALEELDERDLEFLTEFLLVAATLIQMKVRRMLPEPPAADSEEVFEDLSERDLLLTRLSECSAFRLVSRKLRHLMESAALSRPRTAGVIEQRWLSVAPPLLRGVSPEEVRSACLAAMTRAPAPAPGVDVTHITAISITVGDAVAELVSGMTGRRSDTFRRLTEGVDDRIGLVVRFLALLELVKQGLVDVEQATTFGDIVVSWTGGAGVAVETVTAGVDAYDG